MTINRNHQDVPLEVQSDISAGKTLFEEALNEKPKDEHHEHILNTLESIIIKLDDEKKNADSYLFNHAEFVEACKHVIPDQLSAIRKDALTLKEFSTRFNHWFIFCDAVANLGISCLYPKEALKDKDYAAVFKTLKLNKAFESSLLTPHGIKIEFRHKNKQVMEKYPWLAMPVLIINDDAGVEHQVAITPSHHAAVWWLDILANFHGSYDWVLTEPYESGEEEEEESK